MAEKSLFLEFMGESPTMKVIDYLITERELDFSITDIADNSSIGRATLYRILDGLMQNKIIVPTRKVGKARLFKLNSKNKKISKLIEIYDLLIVEELQKRIPAKNDAKGSFEVTA
jgi:Fe2+ or Zn2+ uptake regulation protein